MSKIVAIEGICCSGKSTLCELLKKTTGALVVPEYGTFGMTFPQKPLDLSGLHDNFLFFKKLEKKRRGLVDLHPETRLKVLDRSFITCCAYDYADTLESGLAHTLSSIENWWKINDEKIVPDLVIILKITESTFKERLAQCKRVLQSPLDNWVFNLNFYDYLETVSQRWGFEVKSIDVDLLTPVEVAMCVKNLVES